jgi:two-component system chemotaxis sensor kinase CheA
VLNDLFRSVHTLKGNCGLFEFKPLEQVVHAAEDLLDRVRNRTLPYSAVLADALLDAMDYSAQLIDQIERSGRIADGAEARSLQHVQALRALLGDEAQPVAAPATTPLQQDAAPAAAAPPNWLARLPDGVWGRDDGAWALRYQPEAGCFFKGEDPWRLACTTPGLQHLLVDGAEPWPEGAALNAWDCYGCNLDIVLLTTADRASVDEHFRCVSEQVQCHQPAATPAPTSMPAAHASGPGTPAAPGTVPAALRLRASALWSDQEALLQRGPPSAGALLAVRRSLQGLLGALGDTVSLQALMSLSPQATAGDLLAWARQHTAMRGTVETADDVGAVDPDTVEAAVRSDDTAGLGQHRVLKVSQDKIDHLMDLIGEMVVAKNSLPYLAQRAEDVFQQRDLAREIKAQYAVINRIAEGMQHAIMQVRMLPVGTVFQRFGRLVRDLSRRLGKEVNLVIEGEDTEADKNVIEPLADPLIHILRNSLDHGIELPGLRLAAGKPAAGTIRITARQESDRVIIEIADDGAGVDPARVRNKAVERGLIPADRAATLSDADAVQLVFLPGFSTVDAISDLSGRGVGMDVVRNAVERINGGVELASEYGKGTTIRLSLPLSMAVTNVMVIACGGRRLGVPMDLIVETVRLHGDDVHHFKHARTAVLRGRIVTLHALHDLLGLDERPLLNEQGELAVLVVRLGGESVGLLVDHFHGASDIILKPLEGVLSGLTGFAGTALMGDGGVLMVLNPKELLSWPSAT